MKPKLLIFINSLELGGAERVVSHLLRHLNSDVDIHLAMYNKQIEYDIPKNIPIFDLGQPLHENPISIFLKLPLFSCFFIVCFNELYAIFEHSWDSVPEFL